MAFLPDGDSTPDCTDVYYTSSHQDELPLDESHLSNGERMILKEIRSLRRDFNDFTTVKKKVGKPHSKRNYWDAAAKILSEHVRKGMTLNFDKVCQIKDLPCSIKQSGEWSRLSILMTNIDPDHLLRFRKDSILEINSKGEARVVGNEFSSSEILVAHNKKACIAQYEILTSNDSKIKIDDQYLNKLRTMKIAQSKLRGWE